MASRRVYHYTRCNDLTGYPFVPYFMLAKYDWRTLFLLFTLKLTYLYVNLLLFVD